MPRPSVPPLRTPDGRYLVVRGGLWRASNPALEAAEREHLTHRLMDARRAVGAALRARDTLALARARESVNEAKVALGERGPVWWTDGAPDWNRYPISRTPYADWYAKLPPQDRSFQADVGA